MAEWQTQQTQNLPMATSWGFKSLLRHQPSLAFGETTAWRAIRSSFRVNTINGGNPDFPSYT